MSEINIAELRSLLAKATPGPWAYRPREHDDWGFIRVADPDAEGWQPIVALGRSGGSDGDHDEHRRNKTDPYGPNAELIVSMRNAFPALLDRVVAAADALRTVRDHLANGDVGKAINYIDRQQKGNTHE